MKRISWIFRYTAIYSLLALSACSSGGGGNGDENNGGASIAATQAAYIVVAWNDLGMHCLNPSYDNAVILPPYNTVWAQVVKRGNPPQIVTTGVTVEYSIDGNTYSYGKRSYGQFWDNMLHLFGVSLPHDKGLNLDNPAINNGLSGTMVMKADHFQVNGIPVTPVNDSGTWNPFQVAIITVKDQTGAVLAATRATVPTSDEINCAKCHGNATTDPMLDVLQKHDLLSGTTLTANKPVLCAATCHGSPALGLPPGPNKYLSQAIHSFHATKNALCYDCHPGATTSCNRSTRHTAPDGNCITCHGDLSTVGGSIATGRVPWGSEPKCSTCHIGVAGVDTGAVLYRNDPGHGGIYCAGCHGSPHAMLPSNLASDNYQAIQYQGAAKSLGDCGVCHATSRGGGNDFAGEHVAEGRVSACNVCHTGFINAANITNWPHQFQWKAR